MWFLRTQNIHIEKVTNEEVLIRASEQLQRSLYNNIRQKQARFFRHAMRREGLLADTLSNCQDKGTKITRITKRETDSLTCWLNMTHLVWEHRK